MTLLEQYHDKRMFVFAGHYGSGKTETAVNFALALAAQGDKTAIVDFDIVNPYFRTTDAKNTLEQHGIRVVSSRYANSNIDIPALPAEINALFEDKQMRSVFDVGGDDIGAKAVSRYRDDFLVNSSVMFFVMNIRRPMTTTVDKAEHIFYEVQDSARMRFDAIINNTNLLQQTDCEDLETGLDTVLRFAERVKLPLAFSTLMDTTSQAVSERFREQSAKLGIPIFPLSKHIKMDYHND